MTKKCERKRLRPVTTSLNALLRGRARDEHYRADLRGPCELKRPRSSWNGRTAFHAFDGRGAHA
jgi:hypothetical protein